MHREILFSGFSVTFRCFPSPRNIIAISELIGRLLGKVGASILG